MIVRVKVRTWVTVAAAPPCTVVVIVCVLAKVVANTVSMRVDGASVRETVTTGIEVRVAAPGTWTMTVEPPIVCVSVATPPVCLFEIVTPTMVVEGSAVITLERVENEVTVEPESAACPPLSCHRQ